MKTIIKFRTASAKRKALQQHYSAASSFLAAKPELSIFDRVKNTFPNITGRTTLIDLGDKSIVVDDERFLDLEAAGEIRRIENTEIKLNLFRSSGPGGASGPKDVNWGIIDTGIDQIKSPSQSGKGVRVAIIDSGVDSSHKTFAALMNENRLVAYAKFDKDGKKEVESRYGPSGFSSSHGTHCAGTICGNAGGAENIGLAYQVELIVVEIIDASNSFSVANMIAALEWLKPFKCDFVSMSLGWQGLRSVWMEEVESLIDTGAFLICAAGNDYGSISNYRNMSPANYPFSSSHPNGGGMISVGAVDRGLNVWSSSGGGEETWNASALADVELGLKNRLLNAIVTVPSVTAPGVDIGSAIAGDAYDVNTGTSMAAPFATGVLSLLLSRLRLTNPAAKGADAWQQLSAALTDLGASGADIRYGIGIIDKEAVNRLTAS